MKCVTLLGLYVFSATSSITPTAASNRINRAAIVSEKLVRLKDQSNEVVEERPTYQKLVHARVRRQPLSGNLRNPFCT